MVEAAEIEPLEAENEKPISAQQDDAKALQNNTLESSTTPADSQRPTHPVQDQHTSQQPECVPGVYLHDLPDALAAVVRAWPTLPQGTRKKIISLAQQKEAT
jgi:hypothetical protein